MGSLVNYVTTLHQATNRSYIERMVDNKINCMKKATCLLFLSRRGNSHRNSLRWQSALSN